MHGDSCAREFDGRGVTVVFSLVVTGIVLLFSWATQVFAQQNYESALSNLLVPRDVKQGDWIPDRHCQLESRVLQSHPSRSKDRRRHTAESRSQWQQLGPEGGFISSLAMHPHDPNIIYASSHTYPSKIYRTTNGAETWNLLSTVDGWVKCLAISPHTPTTLYASTQGEYLYRSTDAGLSWTGYRTNGDNGTIYSLTPHPANSKTVWGAADAYRDGHFVMAFARSVDGAMTWSFTDLVASAWGAGSSVAVDPSDFNTIYVGGYYYGGDYTPHPAIFKTSDAGLQWTDMSSYMDTLGVSGYVHTILVDPANSLNVYAGGRYWDEEWNGFYLFKSTDGGSTWAAASLGLTSPVNSIGIDVSSFPKVLYVGTYDGVFRSVTEGLSWNSTGPGMAGKYVRSLLVDTVSPSTLYAANQTGVFKTTDEGASWFWSSSSIVATEICALAIAHSVSNTIYAGLESDALYKSTDSGSDWVRLQEFPGCHGVEALAVDPRDADKIFLFTGG